MKVLLIYVGAFPDEKLHDFLMRFQDGIEERCPVAASFEFEEYDDDCPGPPYAVCWTPYRPSRETDIVWRTHELDETAPQDIRATPVGIDWSIVTNICKGILEVANGGES